MGDDGIEELAYWIARSTVHKDRAERAEAEVARLREREEGMRAWIAGIPARIAENEFLSQQTQDFATGVVEGILGVWFNEGPVAALNRREAKGHS